jgi:hypothetical protein
MHAMSHRDVWFLACSSGVSVYEPAVHCTIMILLTVSQVELPTIQIATTRSD